MTTDETFERVDDDQGARRDEDQPAAPDYLSTDDLARIRDELTMGDTWRSRDLEPTDQKKAGQLALWIVAKRLGLAKPAPNDDRDEFYAFLDRMKVDDVNATYGKAAEAERGPKSADGQDSPDSVSTGE